MMSKQLRHHLALAALAVCLLPPTAATAAGDTPAGFDLRRTDEVVARKGDPEAAAKLFLAFLREEVDSPSPTRKGIGGGPITHDYILAQFVLTGWEAQVSRTTLAAEVVRSKPGEYRDCIRLTLGILGDRSQVDFLIKYLGTTGNSKYLRKLAARGLKTCPDAKAIPVLHAALADPNYLVVDHVGPKRKQYTIRQAAWAALVALEKARISIPLAVRLDRDRAVRVEFLE